MSNPTLEGLSKSFDRERVFRYDDVLTWASAITRRVAELDEVAEYGGSLRLERRSKPFTTVVKLEDLYQLNVLPKNQDGLPRLIINRREVFIGKDKGTLKRQKLARVEFNPRSPRGRVAFEIGVGLSDVDYSGVHSPRKGYEAFVPDEYRGPGRFVGAGGGRYISNLLLEEVVELVNYPARFDLYPAGEEFNEETTSLAT